MTTVYLPGKGYCQPSEPRLSASRLDASLREADRDGVEVGVSIRQVTAETVDFMLYGEHGVLCHGYNELFKAYLPKPVQSHALT